MNLKNNNNNNNDINYVYSLLIRFMKEHGIYYRVLEIYSQCHKDKTIFEMLGYRKNYECFFQMTDSFTAWFVTKEGQQYWEKISFYWRVYLYSLDVPASIHDLEMHANELIYKKSLTKKEVLNLHPKMELLNYSN